MTGYGAKDAKGIVEAFWAAMCANDFPGASQILDESYVLEWPQSGEVIRGRDNFVAVNERYPAAGPWRFTIHRIIAEGDQVVSQLGVTDGVVNATAITFSTVKDGRILKQVEYWPDPFEPAPWRREWVRANDPQQR